MFETTQLNVENQNVEKRFMFLFLTMTVMLIIPVVIILSLLVDHGLPALSIDFFLTDPTNGMTEGGIFPALVGTLWIVLIALITSVPVGVAAAVGEYAPDNWLTRLINWPL